VGIREVQAGPCGRPHLAARDRIDAWTEAADRATSRRQEARARHTDAGARELPARREAVAARIDVQAPTVGDEAAEVAIGNDALGRGWGAVPEVAFLVEQPARAGAADAARVGDHIARWQCGEAAAADAQQAVAPELDGVAARRVDARIRAHAAGVGAQRA